MGKGYSLESYPVQERGYKDLSSGILDNILKPILRVTTTGAVVLTLACKDHSSYIKEGIDVQQLTNIFFAAPEDTVVPGYGETTVSQELQKALDRMDPPQKDSFVEAWGKDVIKTAWENIYCYKNKRKHPSYLPADRPSRFPNLRAAGNGLYRQRFKGKRIKR